MASIDAKVGLGLFLVKKYLVDTTDADNKGEFGLSGDIDVSVLFGLTLASDLETLLVSVGLGVRRSALKFKIFFLKLVVYQL